MNKTYAKDLILDEANLLGVTPSVLTGKCRKRYLVEGRMRIIRRLYESGWSMSKIADILDYSDHTTVLYHLKKDVRS